MSRPAAGSTATWYTSRNQSPATRPPPRGFCRAPPRRFHLDRLVEKDLLDTPVPGGTPCQALPALALARGRITAQCRYDLARSLLSGPFEHAERFGGSPRAILGTRAYQLGNQLGETARSTVGDTTLTTQHCGYSRNTASNCASTATTVRQLPLPRPGAGEHRNVCGMNLRLLERL